ncbi:hypothetical protein G7046_g8409 [Stylonectria norvegica]|nr:hypothetical protein G7046_g8409 [Stylonectria norvegica]
MDAGPPSSNTTSSGLVVPILFSANRTPASASATAPDADPGFRFATAETLRACPSRRAKLVATESRSVMSNGLSVAPVKGSSSTVDIGNPSPQSRSSLFLRVGMTSATLCQVKDRTLVEILDRLTSVENKIDSLNFKSNPTSQIYDTSQASSVYPAATSLLVDPEGQDSPLPASSAPPTTPTTTQQSGGYRYDSSVSGMLEWPVMRQMFESLGQKPQSPLRESDVLALPRGLHDSVTSLSVEGVQPMGLPGDNDMRVPLQFSGPQPRIDLGPPTIDWETMQRLSKSYFDAFNFIYPIMDRQWFSTNTLTAIINNGFQDGTASTLALLVFALGEVSLTASGVPISIYKGRPSGIKGGTLDRPPGLTYFNEARKRMGFSLTEISLENVQMFALAALYHESCGQAIECWRMSALASIACQALVTRFLHMEFELPLTGLEKLDDAIGLPDFSGLITDDDYIGNQTTHFQEHFASQIVLRRLSVSFHSALSTSFGSASSLPFHGLGSFSGPSADGNPSTMKHLVAQLDQWRRMLPAHLRWQDEQSTIFPDPPHGNFGPVYPSQGLQSSFMFTSNLDNPPTSYLYGADIQVALLRTRYYYNKYLIQRPFIFKALHHPEALTREDAEEPQNASRLL